jgi:hypothetical protein
MGNKSIQWPITDYSKKMAVFYSKKTAVRYFLTDIPIQGSFSPAFGTAATTTIALCSLSLGAEMRTNPTLTATATEWVLSDGANTSIDLTAISIQPSANSVTSPMIRCEVASGLTQYRPYFLAADVNQNRKLIFSAEL